MYNPPYTVLGTYIPKKGRKCWFIGKALTRRTALMGMKPLVDPYIKQNAGAAWYSPELHAECRKTAVLGSEGTSWHQDGDTSPGANMKHGLILWANSNPTEIYSVHSDKIVYQPKPYEVVLVHNLDCRHRRPPHVEGFRLSFRQRVTI